MNREFASRIIAVINDLMNEAVGGGVVQEWGEVNNVLIELEKIAKNTKKIKKFSLSAARLQ